MLEQQQDKPGSSEHQASPASEARYVGRALDVIACHIKVADAAAAVAFAAGAAASPGNGVAGPQAISGRSSHGSMGAVAPEPSGASDSSVEPAQQAAAAGAAGDTKGSESPSGTESRSGTTSTPADQQLSEYEKQQAKSLRQAGDMLKGLSLGGAPLLEQCQHLGQVPDVDPRLVARAQQLHMALASVQGSTVQV
jgi:hypothetical protein